MNEPRRTSSAAGGAALFDEKSFYLEEFYGKSLLFALIPPSGERLGELDSLVRTLRELHRHQTRCIVIVSADTLARADAPAGTARAQSRTSAVFNPGAGLRSRPYPPDSAVAQIWRALSAGSIVVAAADTNKPGEFTVFAAELANRLRVFKLILLDRQGGLTGASGERISFVELSRIRRCDAQANALARARAQLRAAVRALRRRRRLRQPGRAARRLRGAVQLHRRRHALHRDASTASCGPISIDDFEEVEALILRGQTRGPPAAAHARGDRATAAVMLRLPSRRRASGRNLLAADRALPSRATPARSPRSTR